MKSYAQIAQSMYAAYCAQAEGKAFNGSTLPTFDELGADRQACWEAAAQAAHLEITQVH